MQTMVVVAFQQMVETWTDLDFPTSQLYHIMVTKDFPYYVCGAQQDNLYNVLPSEGWDFQTSQRDHINNVIILLVVENLDI